MNRYSRPLPARISRLDDLAVDLWWSWHSARQVFRRLDYPLWRATAHNPVRMLGVIPAATLEAAATNPEFLALYDAAIDALDGARAARNTWWTRTHPQANGQSIAHFSAEFALHQSLPIYAGGLGVLAGDHVRRRATSGASHRCRLHVPAGLLPPARLRRRLAGGSYERLNWADAPIEPAMTKEGRTCITAVPLGDRSVLVAVWRVRIGRVMLYLLDTNLEENAPVTATSRRGCTAATGETRIQQEIVLGIGGVRALHAIGVRAGGVPPQRRARCIRRPAAASRA